MLQVQNLSVKIGDKPILTDVSLSFESGKTYFLLGKNGSGKSSLAYTISGNPKYKVTAGDISEWGVRLNDMKVHERANKAGIFLSFQNVPEIPGVKLLEYLRTIYNENQKAKNPESKPMSPFVFKRFVTGLVSELNLDETFLDRDLNVGFSGGEKRKIELLQIKLLSPRYIILDEIDSGLDIDAFKVVASELKKLKNQENTLIFITHNFGLLEYVDVDGVYVLEEGRLTDSWGVELARHIQKEGYCGYCRSGQECDLQQKCM